RGDRLQPRLRRRPRHGRYGRPLAVRRSLGAAPAGRGGELPRSSPPADQRRTRRGAEAVQPAQLGRQRPPARPVPVEAGRRGGIAVNAVIRQAAAMLLCYPDRTLYDRLDLVRGAVAELPPGRARRSLERCCGHLAAEPGLAAGAPFVRTFDLKRRRTLHMTYYTDGDTRRRGHALARLKEVYRGCGWVLDGAELPDHLAVVLE